MHEVSNGERTLTDLDFARLTKLLDRQAQPRLADLLAGAEVTSSRAVGQGVVTMYSRIELLDLATHRRQTLTVCYPGDAEPAAGLVSVLSPVGLGVLGLKVEDVATWHTPHGDECAARVAAILFQPEAHGDYST